MRKASSAKLGKTPKEIEQKLSIRKHVFLQNAFVLSIAILESATFYPAKIYALKYYAFNVLNIFSYMRLRESARVICTQGRYFLIKQTMSWSLKFELNNWYESGCSNDHIHVFFSISN